MPDPAWIPLLVCGFPVAKEALDALVGEQRIRATLLISVAMVACVAIGQFFAAGDVAFIMVLGEKLEDWTVNRAKKGLHKLADVGIAMGGIGAADIAQEYADVALVMDDLTAIPYRKRLSVACVRLIKFNIIVAMSINV